MYRISKVETGKKIRKLMNRYGVTVREVQEEMELESPQAVYKWLNGRAIPSTENLLILGKLLNVAMEDMIVLEQDRMEKDHKEEWDKKHPPVFMAYKMPIEEPVREVDSRRYAHFLEDIAQERAMAAFCAN